MKKIGKIAVKVLALYFLVRFIGSIGNLISLVSVTLVDGENYSAEGLTSISITVLVNLLMVVLLWVFSEKIAKVIVGNKDEELQVHVNINYNEALKVSLKIVGTILIIFSMEEAILGIVNVIGINLSYYDARQSFVMLIELLFPFIKIGIGLMLLTSKKVQEKIGIIEES